MKATPLYRINKIETATTTRFQLLGRTRSARTWTVLGTFCREADAANAIPESDERTAQRRYPQGGINGCW
jgi:hypothetical protein